MTKLNLQSVRFENGLAMPRFGVGTWRMGESNAHRKVEAAALAHALDAGVRLVDTAEMYGDGGAEEMLGTVLRGRRETIQIVSKVYPHNASETGVIAACERSLSRLGVAHIDLYLLHWRGSIPLASTVRGFEKLKRAGKILNWGVSNFDVDDMQELAAVPDGQNCAVNQVLYHLGERGIEFDLVQAMRKRGIPIMAYSPLGQGPLLRSDVLRAIADKHGVSSAAIALAFLLQQPGTIVIPKASNIQHIDQNIAALGVELDAHDLAALERAFPPPRRKQPLAMT